MDSLATGASRFCADAGAAPGTIAKAMHVTNPDMTIPDEFDPNRMMLPLLRLDGAPEAASARRARKIYQIIDAEFVAGPLLLKKVLTHQESEMRRNTFGKVSYFQPASRAASGLEPTRTETAGLTCGSQSGRFRGSSERATLD